jgi:transposase-like protein
MRKRIRCPRCGSTDLDFNGIDDEGAGYGCRKCRTMFTIWSEEHEIGGKDEEDG